MTSGTSPPEYGPHRTIIANNEKSVYETRAAKDTLYIIHPEAARDTENVLHADAVAFLASGRCS